MENLKAFLLKLPFAFGLLVFATVTLVIISAPKSVGQKELLASLSDELHRSIAAE